MSDRLVVGGLDRTRVNSYLLCLYNILLNLFFRFIELFILQKSKNIILHIHAYSTNTSCIF